ncbi:MAG: hypothetical protein J5764_06205 [Bacteroidales bacterium]|nr:hypothetical protein [Bacteroidales bacterium]
MKKILSIITGAGLLIQGFAAFAQGSQPTPIPMAVSINEASSNIPAASRNYLETKLNSLVTNGGMGSTADFSQFYLTCSYNLVEKHVVSGAPTKYFQTIEMTFSVVDALASKIFSSTSIEVKGIGNSEEQANTNSIRQFSPSNKSLTAFISESGKKIVAYYDSQYKNIISRAQSLAKVKSYDEALFQLSLVPEACSGYQEVVEAANGIYQKYLDNEAQQNLAKATAIWNAGQNAEAAAAAGEYLALINPDASCYPQAVELNDEIKKRIKRDIDYFRRINEEDRQMAHQERMSQIAAWKAVGVAYGNNQKTQYYYRSIY